MRTFTYILASLCVLSPQVWGTTYTVTNTLDNGTFQPGTLSLAISNTNAVLGIISFTVPSVTLTGSALPPIISSGTHLMGSGVTIIGTNTSRIFFINAAGVTLQDMTLQGGVARGGAGNIASPNEGASGGGGLGAGGAVFVGNTGTVTLLNISFTGNSSIGGAGGAQLTAGPSSGPLYGGGGGGGGLDYIGGAGGAASPPAGGAAGSGGGGGGGGCNAYSTALAANGLGGAFSSSGAGGAGANSISGGASVSGTAPIAGNNGGNGSNPGDGGGGGSGQLSEVQPGDPEDDYFSEPGGAGGTGAFPAYSGSGLGNNIFLNSGGTLQLTVTNSQTLSFPIIGDNL
ncbi:MAG: hypothetical protein NTX49_09575, partial [Chlamydiae bacterium]|nr:hypothetical protein [Chlamydiota bacterium]